ncbi:tetratricopeptide repeat protein [Hyphococcus luteus]|nr:tetratricopeptide repeat protein [Marinicaulis flavus]
MTASAKHFMRAVKNARPWRVSRLAAVSLLAMSAACASPEQKVERYSNEAAEFFENGELTKAYIQYQNVLKIDEENVPALLGLAEIAEQRQDFQGMFSYLQRVLRLDPNQVDARVKIGKIYLLGSDETAALEEAEKALELEPDNLDAMALKAGVLLKIGDNASAVELARQVLGRDPANPEAVTVIVTDHMTKNEKEEALAELDKALDIDPQLAMLQLLRIYVLQSLDRTDDVREAYARMIELFPEQTAYRRVYAGELIRLGEYEAARKQLEAVVEKEPGNLAVKMDVVRVIKAGEGNAAAEAKLKSYVEADPDNVDLKFALVDYYLGEDTPEKANDLLDELAGSDDIDISLRAKNKLAGTLMNSGDKEAAHALTDEILAADDRNTQALLRRAAFEIEAEEYDQAIVDLRTVLDNSPDTYQANVLMSAAFEAQGNASFARAELAKSFENSNRDPNVANHFAKFLLRQKDADRAEEVLLDSLAAHEDDVENMKLLASIRLARQDWRGAEEVGEMIERAGGDSALGSNVKAAAYVGLEDYDSVIETLNERQAQRPLDTQPLAALVNAYIRQDRTDEAEAMLERMLENEPDNYPALILLARVYSEKGQMEDAESTLVKATQASPDRAQAYEILYRTYLSRGQQDKAAALIERGLAAAPDNDALKVYKADVLLSQGRREEALDLYSELIKVRPNDRIIANNFVSLSSDLRQDEKSVARALEVAKVIENLGNPYFRDTVGWAYYRAGEYDKALQYLKEAAAGAENNGEILYHLGAAQAASGDEAAAKATLEKALSVSGEDFAFVNEVRTLLDRL